VAKATKNKKSEVGCHVGLDFYDLLIEEALKIPRPRSTRSCNVQPTSVVPNAAWEAVAMGKQRIKPNFRRRALRLQNECGSVQIALKLATNSLISGVTIMNDSPFVITFPGASAADANRYAADLATALQELDEEIQVSQDRDRPDTQDCGTILQIVLGAASVTAVAKGVAAWLARHSGARIQINTDGSVVASNLESRDAARIAEAFGRHK
jgi:hypothetical protein